VTPGNSGNYSVTATVSSSNNTNSNQPDSATASFVAGGFSLSIAPAAQNVVAGHPTTYSLTLAPTQGSFGSPISLSCGPLPGATGCIFTPSSSVTLNNGGQSVTLNLTTTPQPVAAVTPGAWRSPLYALGLVVPGMALLGLGAGGKRRRGKMSRVLGLLMLSVFFTLILLQPSCSSGKTQPTVSGTPTGTYQLTVTATSGTLSKSVPFGLTVTP
jgi:serine protease AprX